MAIEMQEPVTVRALQAGIAPAYAWLAGMELGVFTALGAGPLDGPAVAGILGVSTSRLERLLYALVLAGLLEHRDGCFRNTPEAARFLDRTSPDYIGDEHELDAELWRADLETARSIREGRPAARHDYANITPAATMSFLRGLAPGAFAFGRELADSFDLSACRSALDIGGGPGSALVALRRRHPNLAATLFELQQILPVSRELLGEEARDFHFEAGDITKAPPRSHHDIILMKALVQVLSAEDAGRAIRNAATALAPGGYLFVAGVGIIEDDHLSPAPAVYYNITFLNLYADGASYLKSDYSRWASEAGLGEIAFSIMPSGIPLMSARAPR